MRPQEAILSRAPEHPTVELEAELLAAVQRHAPERFARLMKLKDEDPERYLIALETVEELLLEKDTRVRERRERLREMGAQRDELLRRYDSARNDRQRDEIRAEMEAEGILPDNYLDAKAPVAVS